MLHRKDLNLDGSAPLFLEGYGAYSFVFPAAFDSNLLSLVDRGFRLRHRACSRRIGERRALAQRRAAAQQGQLVHRFHRSGGASDRGAIHRAGRIVARGDFAGGLLMGAVANMRPELFAGIIARVPYVDTLNTLLDESLPLTVGDFPEFGDPIRDLAAYRNVASYSPYENVAAQPYPHMLVTAGIRDPRVPYWEPAKWVAKIRAMKTNDARIMLVTHMSAGHFGVPGRFEGLDELGSIQAFALEVTGIAAARRIGDARRFAPRANHRARKLRPCVRRRRAQAPSAIGRSKPVSAPAASEIGDPQSEIQSDLARHRDRLQRDGAVGAADEHIGAEAYRNGDLAARTHIIAGEKARSAEGAGEHRPYHDAAGGDADIEAEPGDRTDIDFLRTRQLRREHTGHLLLRADDQADAGRDIAGQHPGLDPLGGRRLRRCESRRPRRRAPIV